MIWFEILFPAVMLTWPATVMLCVRAQPDRARPDAPALTRQALWATLVAVLLYGLLTLAAEAGLEGTLALWRGWNIAVPVTFSMALWFRFAVRALAARSPGWDSAALQAPRRSASLAPRQSAPGLPGWAWWLGWSLWAACLAALVWAVVQGASATLVLGALFFPGFAWGCKGLRAEAEPRDAGGSPELDEAYADLRRFRAWAFWGCGLAGSLAFGVMALLATEGGPSAGLYGALGGAGVGLLGATLGTLASLKRARINALLSELQQQGNGC